MSAIIAERSYLLDELGDPNAPVGSRLWCLYMANEIRKDLYENTQSEQRLYYLVKRFKEIAGWEPLGFDSWQEFCHKRLQTESERVDTKAMMIAKAAKNINENGGDRKSTEYQSYDRKTDIHVFGNGNDYLTARIARDRPDILERMKAGEFRSVRQAAIEAGILVDRKKFHVYTDDPAAAGRYLAQRVDREWIEAMIEEYLRAKEL